jgi:hypothetical protein
MNMIIQLSEVEEVKALPILLRHSPGTILPNRIYIVSEDAAKAVARSRGAVHRLEPHVQRANRRGSQPG